jgi:solute carrier family 25 (mitochondrial carnitine/acylcarnitine transporter), member 20/29
MAGIANSFISGPVEHIRIRLQTQLETSPRKYTGTFDCAQKLYRQGGIRGLYRGQTATIIREFHSFGIWFSMYEVLVTQLMTLRNGESREELPSWQIACCGGLVGEVLWAAIYPIDIVKSKMQADGFGREQLYRNVRDVVRKTWTSNGLRGFYHGLSPALYRAIPVSAGTFVV